jgi:hypothetical protein
VTLYEYNADNEKLEYPPTMLGVRQESGATHLGVCRRTPKPG